MRNYFGEFQACATKHGFCAVIACWTVFCASLLDASAALKILALGDSLTYGAGELSGGYGGFTAPDNLGYRRYLQEMLWEEGVDYDFVGGLAAGARSPFDPNAPIYTGETEIINSRGQVRDLDLDHFGWPGASAAVKGRNLSSALYSQQTSYFPVPISPTAQSLIPESSLRFDNDGNTTQDVAVYGGLIQQDFAGSGTDYNGPAPGFAFDTTSVALSANPNSSADWIPSVPDVVLLHIGTNSIGTQSNTVAKSVDALATLLSTLERDWRDGLIAEDAKIIVAKILPLLSGNVGIPFADFRFINNSYLYNEAIDGLILGLSPDFRSQITTVSMSEIEINQGLLDSLGLADDSLLNPDPSDNFVDWITGEYDESTNTGFVPFSIPPVNSANTNLFGNSDFIHPNSLGYQVMAYQWFTAMKQAGVVPEPSSLLLFILGTLSFSFYFSGVRRVRSPMNLEP